MLSPEQIKFELDDVIKKMKRHHMDAKKQGGKKRPEFYPGYNELCDQYESIAIHSEKGIFPDKLFAERSPNQQPDEFEYIKKNYKQTTLPIFIDYVNQIKRSFNDGNWNIVYGETPNAKKFQEYIERAVPVYGSLEEFEKEIIPVVKSKDPMGMIAIRPKELPIVYDDSGMPKLTEDGRQIIDESIAIAPAPNYFTIEQVIKFKEGKWYMFHSRHKSMVMDGNSYCEEGMIFEVYDEKNIWFVKQIGRKSEYQFEIHLFYTHDLGYVPCRRLKGVPVIKEDSVIYQSPYLYATDTLDLILLNSSNLQMSINHCVYPVRVMIGNECDFQEGESRCTDGFISFYDGQVHRTKTCPSCNGSGLKTRISPLGTILLRPSDRDNPNGEITPDGAFRYISPELSSLEFLSKKIQEDESRARSIAHIYNSNTNAQGSDSETATGKYIDQKSLYAFIKPISDEIFEGYRWDVKTIGLMRDGSNFEAPIITNPITFEFLTEQDYIMQIKSAMDAGMPPSVIYPLIHRFLSTLFYTDANTNKAFMLIANADRLLTQTETQISTGIINNTVQKWEKILHDSGFYFIKELLQENDNFFDQDIEKQKEQLFAKAQEKANELQPIAAGANEALAALGGGGAALDAEAEAKAKLRGTVGGVEGIISINAAVAEGTMSEASAELLLAQIYGFDEDVAKKLIEAPDKEQLKKLAEQQTVLAKTTNANSGTTA